jgi:leucyl-tRNA synthetase
MSKSRRNVVDPEEIIARYGADTARWFMLSDTPPERDIEWTEAGVAGSWRFVQRLWRMINDIAERPGQRARQETPAETALRHALEIRRAAHQALHAVGSDIEALRFNRAIARIYELANVLQSGLQEPPSDGLEPVCERRPRSSPASLRPWCPISPNSAGGRSATIVVAETPWPVADPALLVSDTVTVAVQVNGKRRAELGIERGLGNDEVEAAVLKLDNVRRAIDGKPIRKVIVVPDRIVNVVTG